MYYKNKKFDLNVLFIFDEYSNAKTVTYDIENEKANFIARNIIFIKMVLHIFIYITITIVIIQLNYLFQGKHNVPNALSCTALYDSYELNKMSIKSSLKK